MDDGPKINRFRATFLSSFICSLKKHNFVYSVPSSDEEGSGNIVSTF